MWALHANCQISQFMWHCDKTAKSISFSLHSHSIYIIGNVYKRYIDYNE